MEGVHVRDPLIQVNSVSIRRGDRDVEQMATKWGKKGCRPTDGVMLVLHWRQASETQRSCSFFGSTPPFN